MAHNHVRYILQMFSGKKKTFWCIVENMLTHFGPPFWIGP